MDKDNPDLNEGEATTNITYLLAGCYETANTESFDKILLVRVEIKMLRGQVPCLKCSILHIKQIQ